MSIDVQLYNEDCLSVFPNIEDNSIDMILTDPPFETTACSWDTIIPFDKLWPQLRRIIKPDGAIVLNAAQPFTSKLILSAEDIFKYSLIWQKSKICHFAQAPYRFLTEHEDICVFSTGGTSKNAKIRMKYNPQGTRRCNKMMKGKGHSDHRPSKIQQDNYKQTVTGYPKSILEFASVSNPIHPTQKPVELMEYLIKTYTNEGDTVLDFTMGSGTTGIAAKVLDRNFIGIEMDKKYFEIATDRIDDVGRLDSLFG